MKSLKVIVALCLAGLFLVPQGLVRASAEAPPASHGRDWNQPAPVTVDLKKNGTAYANSDFTVPIPANATVTSATVDLQGVSSKGPLTAKSCDFSEENAGHKAYKGIVQDFKPGQSAPKSLVGQEFSSDEYAAVAAIDDQVVGNMGDFMGDDDGYQLYSFSVPVDESASVTVFWKGHAEYYYGGGGREFAIYMWNNMTGVWELVDVETVSSDVQVMHQFSNDWYVDNRTIWVLAMCTDGNLIITDYVNITISGYAYYFPKNPSMDIGADGQSEWSLNEARFDYMVGVSDPSIAAALEAAALGSRTRLANVTVRFTAQSLGKMKITNFNVTYSAPPWCSGIPDTFHIDQGTPATKVIDLNGYFTDDRDSGNLNSTVSYQQDSKKVQAILDPDGHSLGFKPISRYWWGTLRFRVRATDTEGLSTESINFTLTVDHLNQPPVIGQMIDQTATQGIPFSLRITARDPDADLDPNETTAYSANVIFFTIDPGTGWINFTPKQSDVGDYLVCVTATDRAGATGSQTFHFTILDAEDPPVLKPIPDQKATEGEAFLYQAVATDPDLPYGDELNFTDDCPLFVIDNATGVISFSPKTKDIGVYRVNITLRDLRGGSDKKAFTLTVLNYMGTLDRPPALEAILAQTVVEGSAFLLQVNATDPDPDDVLTFKDNCPLFVIGASNGTISFTPRSADIGVYSVRITVSDFEGLEAEATFRLTVLKFNHPPVITSMRPKNGARVLPNTDVIMSADATDADMDRLSYTWELDGLVVGSGSMSVIQFDKTGTHNITLVVSDGKDEVTNTSMISVVSSLGGKKSPGFETVLAGACLLSAAAFVTLRRRREP